MRVIFYHVTCVIPIFFQIEVDTPLVFSEASQHTHWGPSTELLSLPRLILLPFTGGFKKILVFSDANLCTLP